MNPLSVNTKNIKYLCLSTWIVRGYVGVRSVWLHHYTGACLLVYLCADVRCPGQRSPPTAVWVCGREQRLLSLFLDTEVLKGGSSSTVT